MTNERDNNIQESIDSITEKYGVNKAMVIFYKMIQTLGNHDRTDTDTVQRWVDYEANSNGWFNVGKTKGRIHALENVKSICANDIMVEVGNMMNVPGTPRWFNIFKGDKIIVSGGTGLETPEEILKEYTETGEVIN